MIRLKVLNLIRWIQRFWFVWGLFALIYGFSASLLLQPLLSFLIQFDIDLLQTFGFLVVILLVSGVSSLLPNLLVFPLRVAGPKGLQGIFFLHSLRSLRFWINLLILVVGFIGCVRYQSKIAWILLAQLPLQAFLFRGYQWVEMAFWLDSKGGASALLRGIQMTFLFQVGLAWVIGLVFGAPFEIAWAVPTIGAVWAASSVALEGDAGRPLLVNFISITAGTLAGTLCVFWWPSVFFVWYFAKQMNGLVQNRLRSIQHWSEDVILS